MRSMARLRSSRLHESPLRSSIYQKVAPAQLYFPRNISKSIAELPNKSAEGRSRGRPEAARPVGSVVPLRDGRGTHALLRH